MRPSHSPCVVQAGQLSHHPLDEEGWARWGRGEPCRRLCINEANLSVNQNGGGTQGRVGAFFTCPIKMPLNPTLLQECHMGSPWDRCVCVCTHTHMLSCTVFLCLLFTIFNAIILKQILSVCLCACYVHAELIMIYFFNVLQGILSTAVRPPMNVRSPKGDASHAKPAAS